MDLIFKLLNNTSSKLITLTTIFYKTVNVPNLLPTTFYTQMNKVTFLLGLINATNIGEMEEKLKGGAMNGGKIYGPLGIIMSGSQECTFYFSFSLLFFYLLKIRRMQVKKGKTITCHAAQLCPQQRANVLSVCNIPIWCLLCVIYL